MDIYRDTPEVDHEQVRLLEARLAEQEQQVPGYEAFFRELSGRLLLLGGHLVVPPSVVDPNVKAYLDHGEQFRAEMVKRPMAVSQCHSNVALLLRMKTIAAIGIGFALFDDGMWRSHSWGFDLENRIVETTQVFSEYFGVRLSPEQGEHFAASQDSRVTVHQFEMFKERIEAQDVDYPGYAESFRKLRGRILEHGGGAVVPPAPLPDAPVNLLLSEGRLVDAEVKKKRGAVSKCHSNIAKLWRNKKLSAIGTGYGLTEEDGLWREHTWGLDHKGFIAETTIVRDKYFGIVLTGERADKFADWVDPLQQS